MTYQCEWSSDNLSVVVLDAYDENRMAIDRKETAAERSRRKAIEAKSTPLDNLMRLIDHRFHKQIAVTEIGQWLETHCIDHKIKRGHKKESITIYFSTVKHATFFKLTWS